MKLSISPYRLEFRCRRNMQKIKIGKPQKQCASQKGLAVIFVEAGNILDWFNQAIGKLWLRFHIVFILTHK